MPSLFDPLAFAHGPAMQNRFALAPLTNRQSHEDGILSDEEFHWLTLRAQGGFGLVMTCGASVQAAGKGFTGQLGIFSDAHIPGLTRLAGAIRERGSLAIVQLLHAGMRAPKELTGQIPVAPSDDAETGARALTAPEVEKVAESFIQAAIRADRAGFDGAELHGAHGYLLCEFLSPDANRRSDRWGGSLENRSLLLRDIIAGVRARCRPDFQLGVRLSPERFGVKLAEMRDLAAELLRAGDIDFLDMSLWDWTKEPAEPEFKGTRLMSHFAALDRGKVRLGVAGRIVTGEDAVHALDAGADFVVIGRSGILHHDFPRRIQQDAHFRPVALPASTAYLRSEGLSPAFVEYMKTFKGFVAQDIAAEA